MALNSLILIHGGETVIADRALHEAIEARKEFERTSIDGGEMEEGRFAEVIAPSLFADKRVVVIKDLHDVSAEVAEEIEIGRAHV